MQRLLVTTEMVLIFLSERGGETLLWWPHSRVLNTALHTAQNTYSPQYFDMRQQKMMKLSLFFLIFWKGDSIMSVQYIVQCSPVTTSCENFKARTVDRGLGFVSLIKVDVRLDYLLSLCYLVLCSPSDSALL